EAVLVPLIFTLIFSFGLIGNILLILSFVKFKKLNAPHNIFVINLAVGDLIMLLVSLPFNSTWYTVPYWPYGLVICKLSFFIETLATAVTIGTITVLSVERFFLISGNRSNNKKQFAIIIVTIIWTLSIILALPDLISATTVVKEHRKWDRESTIDKRKRLALSVLGLVWAFVLCWLPRHIYLLWFHFDPNAFDHFWHVFKIVGFCLMFSNCAVNPIVFYILDKKFRQYVHFILKCQ
ncbi:hypothetical protein LOTGIDRAFT_95484, partial [Lottia gigantea]